ncbi:MULTISPECIES: DUF1847 domain-containing protein [unclassified Archaeoglobus]|jgi:uncharacterized metal-binding protein|uniref:DUF1847 domain-containing protein n=1 Tax=unclassified Archaeoglobus TaxID=2643606 RepID=UPI0032E46616
MVVCGECGRFACYTGELEKAPENCPMKDDRFRALYKASKELYLREGKVRSIALNSARVEASGYGKWTRLEETMEFAKRCNFKKIGLAFCIGLRNEAKTLTSILKRNGFEVVSVVCKTGSVPKEEVGLEKHERIRPDAYEALCNPVAQAMLLNEEGTELNIIFGLCVGHDSLFIMHSKAPVTCLAVKDRVLAHNPMGAIYTYHSYYKSKLVKS